MYNSIYPIQIKPYVPPQTKKAVNKEEDKESSKSSSDLNRESRGLNSTNSSDANGKSAYGRQEFPNGQKSTIDYSKSQVNIAQILTDFKNTALAIGSPPNILQEVEQYLALAETQSLKNEPNKKIIQSNLKNASNVLDEFISKTLNKESKVVENWIEALFLQQVNYKSDPTTINEDFLVKLPDNNGEMKPISQDFTKLPKIMEAIKQGKNFWVDTKKIYDNPYIYPVNPADLVFDTAQVDNWDNCPKIYRSYKTPSDIINNQYYELDDEQKEAISAMVGNSSKVNTTEGEIVNGSTIEVLEHWGDLKLPDGKLLKNWHAVVIGRRFLVEFGKNERIINPFSYGAFISDPETKRGISPLYCVLSLAMFQEDLLNRTCNLQALNENPPLLAPEGFFDEDEIELYPGKIIEYGDNLSPSAAFQQMSFNPTVFLQDISFLNDLMAEVSGIFPNMVGAVESTGTKTATEINTKSQGQMTRLSMLVDTINQDFILPNVEKVAKLCADFKSGVETVFVNKENQPETIEIDDEVRQAEYKYTYSDSSNTTLKSEQADMLVAAVEKFAQKLNLNLEEIFLWYFEQKGVDNPERFLAQANTAVELPQFPQKQPDAMQLLGSVSEGDENAQKRLGLLKQFMNRKASGDMLQNLLTGIRG